MKIAIRVFVMLFLVDVSVVSSQIITETPCAFFATKPMENFDKNRYDGLWFVHQLYDYADSSKYDCYLQIRTKNSNGTQNITDLFVKPGALPTIQFNGLMTYDDEDEGHYLYTNPDYQDDGIELDILDTDYRNYAIEWSCREVATGYYAHWLFILSRFPIVTDYTQKKIDAILTKYHIDKDETRTLDITSCPAQLLQVPVGPGLLGRVLQIVTNLVSGVVGIVGGLLGGILG